MSISRCLCAPALLVAAALPAFSIMIINPAADGYVTGNGSYTGVVKITFQAGSSTYYCSGALLANRRDVLTAGHCVEGAAGWQVTFQTPSGSSTLAVSASFLDPDFGPRTVGMTNLYQYDIAVLRLAGPAPADAVGYFLATDPAVLDDELTLVGYGIGSRTVDGKLASDSSAVRRAGVNYGSVYSWWEDSPVLLGIWPNDPGTPPNYAVAAPGDSGGPLFAGGRIVGVNSFGNISGTGSLPAGYLYTGYENLTYPGLGTWVTTEFLPETPTGELLAGALLVMAGSRKLRAR